MIHSQNFSTHNQKQTNVVKYLAFFCGLLLAILFSPSPSHLLLFWANVRRTREAASNAAQRQLNERNRWGCQTTFSIWLEIVNFSQISQEFCQLNADQSDRCSQSSWILRCIPQGSQWSDQLGNRLTSSRPTNAANRVSLIRLSRYGNNSRRLTKNGAS